MGYFPLPPVIEAHPPLRQWRNLGLYALSLESIEKMNLPDLERLDLEGVRTSGPLCLDLRHCTRLDNLQLFNLPGPVYVDVRQLPLLRIISSDNLDNLISLRCSGCPSLWSVSLTWMGMGQDLVDQILLDVLDSTVMDGFVELPGSAAPGPAGQSAAASLASRGWTLWLGS